MEEPNTQLNNKKEYNSYYKQKPGIKIKTTIILSIVIIIILLVFFIKAYPKITLPPHPRIISNSTKSNLSSINILNVEQAKFVNSSAFYINYTLNYSNIINKSQFSSQSYLSVKRYNAILNYTRYSHTPAEYYNSTLNENVTINVPVIRSTLYNSTGVITCSNNPIVFSISSNQLTANESGFHKYTCSYSIYNTSNTTSIENQQYFNIFLSKIFMINYSNPALVAYKVSNSTLEKYNNQSCEQYNIFYLKNNYTVCFSTRYWIPIFINSTIVSPNNIKHLIIIGKFGSSPINSSSVLNLSNNYIVS